MGCTARYAEAADYEGLLCRGIDLTDATQVATVNGFLDIAAADVHVALAAVGACDCTLASWALVYLKKLNIIDAAVIQNCPCGTRLSDEQRQRWMDWLDKQFGLIASGKLTVCQGDTGADYPAFGIVEHSWTPWNEAEIIANESVRNP